VLLAGRVSFDDLDRAFLGGRTQVQAAYALSGDIVADLHAAGSPRLPAPPPTRSPRTQSPREDKEGSGRFSRLSV
jgi:hypothetical protein